MEQYFSKDPGHPTYDKRQLILANIALVADYTAQVLYAVALEYGKASRVQAIQSFQSVPTIIFGITVLNQYPNICEDVGLGILLLGALIISFQMGE